jgi:hypothetical protein
LATDGQAHHPGPDDTVVGDQVPAGFDHESQLAAGGRAQRPHALADRPEDLRDGRFQAGIPERGQATTEVDVVEADAARQQLAHDRHDRVEGGRPRPYGHLLRSNVE